MRCLGFAASRYLGPSGTVVRGMMAKQPIADARPKGEWLPPPAVEEEEEEGEGDGGRDDGDDGDDGEEDGEEEQREDDEDEDEADKGTGGGSDEL